MSLTAFQAQQEHHQYGLVVGFLFRPDEPGREIDSGQVLEWLARSSSADEFIWLHLNLAHAASERQVFSA